MINSLKLKHNEEVIAIYFDKITLQLVLNISPSLLENTVDYDE